MRILGRIAAAGVVALAATTVQADEATLTNSTGDCPPGDKQCAGADAYAANDVGSRQLKPSDAHDAASMASAIRALPAPDCELVPCPKAKVTERTFASVKAPGTHAVADAPRDLSGDFAAVLPTQARVIGTPVRAAATTALRALGERPGPRLQHAGFSPTERDFSAF